MFNKFLYWNFMNVLFGQSCRNGNKKKDWTNKQSDKEILKIIDTLKRSLFPNSLFKGHLNKYKYIQVTNRQTNRGTDKLPNQTLSN